MTAPLSEFEAVGNVGRACYAAADGRRAARALSQWCERFDLSEPEFQILWCLREGTVSGGFDQTTLAKRLAFSAAQVSATVEKLRARGWISQRASDGDRRRNLWHLSAEGGGAIIEMLRVANELRLELQAAAPEREAAA